MNNLIDQIINTIQGHIEETIIAQDIETSAVESAMQFISETRADLFWYDGKYSWDASTRKLRLYYSHSRREASKIRKNFESALQDKGLDIEKLACKDEFYIAMYLYKWFAWYYNPMSAGTRAPVSPSASIYELLSPACQQADVARLSQYLFARLQIPVRLVSGKIEGCSVRHYWNVIQLAGHNYHFDGSKSLIYWPMGWNLRLHINEFLINDVNYGFFCVSDAEIENLYQETDVPSEWLCPEALPRDVVAKLEAEVSTIDFTLLSLKAYETGPQLNFCLSSASECYESPNVRCEMADEECSPGKVDIQFQPQEKHSQSPCTYEPSTLFPPENNVEESVPSYEAAMTSSAPTGFTGFLSKLIRRRASDTVYSSVYAPTEVRPGQGILIDYFLHQAKDIRCVEELASEAQADAERRYNVQLSAKVKRGEKVTLVCQLYEKNELLYDQRKTVVWNGELSRTTFIYCLDESHQEGEIYCTTLLLVNGTIVGEMAFTTKIVPCPCRTHAQVKAKSFHKVFISYAFKDLETVRMIAFPYRQMNVLHFFDRYHLKAGDVYEEKIYHHIDTADLFLLCWSKNAAASENVAKERARALKHAYPQVSHEQATLEICTVSIEPRAELPEDMRGIYHFQEI